MTAVDPRVAHTRGAVCAAVVQLLLEGGPAEVRHARVAEVANVSRATVYRHWPDRAALIVDAIKAEHEQFDLPDLSGDFIPDLRAMLTVVGEVLNNHQLMPLMVAMLPRVEADPDLANVREELASIRNSPLFPVLDAAHRTGDLPADTDLELASAALFGPLFVLRFVRGVTLTPELLDRHLEQWLHGVAI